MFSARAVFLELTKAIRAHEDGQLSPREGGFEGEREPLRKGSHTFHHSASYTSKLVGLKLREKLLCCGGEVGFSPWALLRGAYWLLGRNCYETLVKKQFWQGQE